MGALDRAAPRHRGGHLTRAEGSKAALTEDWLYSYDALGQLRRVGYKAVGWPADSTVARYGYDVLGRRIAKRVYRAVLAGSVVGERRFVYHGDHVAYETNEAGTIKMKYAWGTGVDDLMGVEDSTGTFYHVVQDQLGSVRGLVKRDGTWRMHQRFTPYGTLLARDSAGALPPLRTGWTGREYDAESGLYFFRARYYDPRQRRFTQEDPIGYGGGGNLYAYVGGAVLEARDPSGLYRDCSFGACGNPHDWSGIPGLDAGGGSVNDGGAGAYSNGDYCLDLSCYLSGSALITYLMVEAIDDFEKYQAAYGTNVIADARAWGEKLAKILRLGSMLDQREFGLLLAELNGAADDSYRYAMTAHLLSGRVGTSHDWKSITAAAGVHSSARGFAPRFGTYYPDWYYLQPALFTDANAATHTLGNCAAHEFAHIRMNKRDRDRSAQTWANEQIPTSWQLCN